MSCEESKGTDTLQACWLEVSGAAGAWHDWGFNRPETYPGGRNAPPPQISKPNPRKPSVTGNMLPVTHCCIGHGDISNDKTSIIYLVKRRENSVAILKTYSSLFKETYITLLNNFVNLSRPSVGCELHFYKFFVQSSSYFIAHDAYRNKEV
jgi:hypothetical protein